MEIKIEWSELSERQLKDIFDYYSFEANSRIARIISKTRMSPQCKIQFCKDENQQKN